MTAVGVNEVEQHHGPVRYGFSRGRAVWAGMDLAVLGARFRWPLTTHEGREQDCVGHWQQDVTSDPREVPCEALASGSKT